MRGRVTVVRPGYIVGPGDTTDRVTYWPVRTSRGGEVLIPVRQDDQVQFIDARDLAQFTIHCVGEANLRASSMPRDQCKGSQFRN